MGMNRGSPQRRFGLKERMSHDLEHLGLKDFLMGCLVVLFILLVVPFLVIMFKISIYLAIIIGVVLAVVLGIALLGRVIRVIVRQSRRNHENF
jgi:xanthine/uracil permease